MSKKFTLLFLVTFLGFACTHEVKQNIQNSGPQAHDQSLDANSSTVIETDSQYAVAPGGTTGQFHSGQEADILLSGIDFQNTGGPLLFNHPGGIASDGEHFILADRNNNRVLVWNELPTSNQAPNVVLGQQNFLDNTPGSNLDQMNWPIAVATDGVQLLVADTYNDRILIWESFPTQSGQAADWELKSPEASGPNGAPGKAPLERRGNIAWPWGVWTDGEKLIVASTAASQVLIWNHFPDKHYVEPDIVLAQDELGTPRSIATDGTHLVVGDHNALDGSQSGTFFWNTFPSSDNQPYDFFVKDPSLMGESEKKNTPGSFFFGPTVTSDGKLLTLTNEGLFIWNKFPESETDGPDMTWTQPGTSYNFGASHSGDGSGVVVVGDTLYTSLANGNKIVGFTSFPRTAGQSPDFSIGAPDIQTNTLDTHFFITNPVPVSDGQSLFVVSDFDRKLYIWKNRPDESGAHPNYVISGIQGYDLALHDQTLVAAGRQAVYIWEELPTQGQAPTQVLTQKIGNIQLTDLKGVALDEKYFYLSDVTQGKVYVWEGIPDEQTDPIITLNIEQPRRLSSDGQYLVVSQTEKSKVLVFSVEDLVHNPSPQEISGFQFNLPQDATVIHGQLFVADTVFNRLHIWNNIQSALDGQAADVILGQAPFDYPQISQATLFWPGASWFDGEYLWVGEFKFSGRLLRFSPSE